LPVIIAKDLSVEEKTALITVLKLHKRAIAWKLFDIKGIDPEFFTHKILMEDDYEPVVQHQRRVNPKIHDVIKNENHKMVGSNFDGYTARFHELARLVTHMVTLEGQCVNRYIRGLAPEIKSRVISSEPTTIQGVVSMANRLTTDGIKDGVFKKKENVENKRRSNDQNKNRKRDDRNKKQRTGKNFSLTTPKQGQGQHQYAGQHPKCAKCNFHHS
nr:hypothetical protein [Tanacetum cinerariifolium]